MEIDGFEYILLFQRGTMLRSFAMTIHPCQFKMFGLDLRFFFGSKDGKY